MPIASIPGGPVRPWWIILASLLAGVALGFAWLRLRAGRRTARERLARATFDDGRADLEPAFLAAAAATGKPRGLRWTGCQLQRGAVFARDKATGELYALVGATVSFEAVAGGGMEEVEAVGNLRAATAVFVFRNGQWTTDGRAVFNLEPAEAIKRFSDSLEPVAATDD